MTFVHGHARDTGWVVSHYRRPGRAGARQLDLDLPAPRRPEEGRADPGDDGRGAQDADDPGTTATTP